MFFKVLRNARRVFRDSENSIEIFLAQHRYLIDPSPRLCAATLINVSCKLETKLFGRCLREAFLEVLIGRLLKKPLILRWNHPSPAVCWLRCAVIFPLN